MMDFGSRFEFPFSRLAVLWSWLCCSRSLALSCSRSLSLSLSLSSIGVVLLFLKARGKETMDRDGDISEKIEDLIMGFDDKISEVKGQCKAINDERIEDLIMAVDDEISEVERQCKAINDKREEIIQRKRKLREVEDELAGLISDAKRKADELKKSGQEKIERGKNYEALYSHAMYMCNLAKEFVPEDEDE